MRRKFRSRNNKKHLSTKYTVFLLSGICVVSIFSGLTLNISGGPLKTIAGYVFIPMQKGINTSGCWILDKANDFRTLSDVLEENNQLQTQVNDLTQQLNTIKLEQYELDNYRELLELDEKYPSYEKIAEVIEEVLAGKNHIQTFEDINYLPKISKRINTTGGYYSYLKIAEGCNKHCTYCIIPKIRGDYRSVPMEQILLEAKALAANGVKELMLVAQETTLYGVDLYGEKRLPKLLKELCKIEGLEWIRILYCYPEEITDELIAVIKEEEKICNYLDIPVQHGSDNVLKRMGRRTNRQELIDIVTKLRKEIPDITLRTTLITGFPGETEEDHEQLKEFVKLLRFDRLGVFTYSPEEDTPAAMMEEQIEEDIKEQRREELMERQQEIAFEQAEDMLYKKLRVMIEAKLPEENVFIGRTYKDAPNVDGFIFVKSSHELISGEFVTVFVTDAKEYDLIGEAVWEE